MFTESRADCIPLGAMQVVQRLCYVQGIDKDSDSLSPDCNRSRVPQWRQKKKDVLQFACKSDISWLIASLPWMEGDYSGFRDKTVGQIGISVHHVITTTFEECFKEQEDSVWIAQSCFTHTILITSWLKTISHFIKPFIYTNTRVCILTPATGINSSLSYRH